MWLIVCFEENMIWGGRCIMELNPERSWEWIKHGIITQNHTLQQFVAGVRFVDDGMFVADVTI